MKVVFRRSALNDLLDISDYIARDSPRAARKVVRRIRAGTRRLARFPRSGRVGLEPETRELVVTGLPYIVVYRLVERPVPAFVEVIAVFHAARDRTGTEQSSE